MAHLSEDYRRLDIETVSLSSLERLKSGAEAESPRVYLLRFPAGRTDLNAACSELAFRRIAKYCSELHEESTVCILTTPPDAARLLPYLEAVLQFQLWIAVKLTRNAYPQSDGKLPEHHAALLVLTRYRGTLRHTKTRIQYTYCPACHKTTKDYGGKKHIYHEYGTLMSDVWRDIECDPYSDITPLIDRLRDLFGLDFYRTLQVLDLRSYLDLAPQRTDAVLEAQLPMEWDSTGIPVESQLLNRDCLEALQSIPDNSVDFCFADPPYNLQKKYDHWNDALESIEYFAWCDQWLSELARVLKPGRTLVVMNIPLWAVRHYQHLGSVLSYQAWIAWEALSFPVRMIMPAHYAVVCFSKGEPRTLPGLSRESLTDSDREALTPMAEFYCLRSSCVAQRRRRGIADQEEASDLWYDIHRLKHNSRRVDHPCQLPPLLMRRLFALFTWPGEVILDCFNGAGTSTLVARQMGRRFIGIELSPRYHEIALKRHEQIARGEDPFGKRDTIPDAKNSRVDRLPQQKYQVTKKTLQLEVKRIARQLGRLPKKEEVESLSKYPIEYFDRYFLSWGEVCAAARTTGMSELPPDMPSPEPQLSLMFAESKET